MDFELDEDQLALRAAARELLDDRARPRDADGFDAELWKAMVEQGWLGVEVAEDAGGLGLGSVEAAVLFEELGAHVAAVPYLQSVLALGALVRAGRDDWASQLLSGEAVGCVAWRPDAPVIGAPLADVAVVVDSDGGSSLRVVELAPSSRPSREPAMDLTRQLGWLGVDPSSGSEIGGPADVEALLDRGAVGHAAEMLGAAQRVLDMSVAYAKDREQFGKPIGSFQAVKHRCADMLVDVEGMRSAVYWAAWSVGAGVADASVAASTAKTWCSDAGMRVVASGLQVHGGIGFTWEHDLHLYMKRMQLDAVSFGDATFHRDRLGRLLRARVEAGESVV